MFKLEKEMIPILRDKLLNKFQSEHCLHEFNCGNGIADLVFFSKEKPEQTNNLFLDYQLMYLIVNYFNKPNKKIYLKEFLEKKSFTPSHIHKITTSLQQNGILEKVSDDLYFVKCKFIPPAKNIVSIEVKLHNWISGLYQALRYKVYSHKSFLAISEEFLHRVNISTLKEQNVGLISVSPTSVKIVFNSKRENPNSMTAHAHLSEKLLSLI